jgi:hypothetical protein
VENHQIGWSLAMLTGIELQIAEEMKKIGQAKAIIATAPSGNAPQQLIPLLSDYGTLIIVGAPADGSSLEVNTMDLISKYARIQGVTCGAAAGNDRLTQWSSQVGVKAMVKEFPLEKIQDAVSLDSQMQMYAPSCYHSHPIHLSAVGRGTEWQAKVPQCNHLQVIQPQTSLGRQSRSRPRRPLLPPHLDC